MKSTELLKLLEQNGWKLIPGRGKGSHRIVERNGIILIIPWHSGDLKKGTLNDILKKAGLK